MSTEQTLSMDNQPVNPEFYDAHEPVRMDAIQVIASMAEATDSPMSIWGNTDRAVAAAEALWVYASRTGLSGNEESACMAVQDLLNDLMHLCEQEGITHPDMPFMSIVDSAQMSYMGEIEDDSNL